MFSCCRHPAKESEESGNKSSGTPSATAVETTQQESRQTMGADSDKGSAEKCNNADNDLVDVGVPEVVVPVSTIELWSSPEREEIQRAPKVKAKAKVQREEEIASVPSSHESDLRETTAMRDAAPYFVSSQPPQKPRRMPRRAKQVPEISENKQKKGVGSGSGKNTRVVQFNEEEEVFKSRDEYLSCRRRITRMRDELRTSLRQLNIDMEPLLKKFKGANRARMDYWDRKKLRDLQEKEKKVGKELLILHRKLSDLERSKAFLDVETGISAARKSGDIQRESDAERLRTLHRIRENRGILDMIPAYDSRVARSAREREIKSPTVVVEVDLYDDNSPEVEEPPAPVDVAEFATGDESTSYLRRSLVRLRTVGSLIGDKPLPFSHKRKNTEKKIHQEEERRFVSSKTVPILQLHPRTVSEDADVRPSARVTNVVSPRIYLDVLEELKSPEKTAHPDDAVEEGSLSYDDIDAIDALILRKEGEIRNLETSTSASHKKGNLLEESDGTYSINPLEVGGVSVRVREGDDSPSPEVQNGRKDNIDRMGASGEWQDTPVVACDMEREDDGSVVIRSDNEDPKSFSPEDGDISPDEGDAPEHEVLDTGAFVDDETDMTIRESEDVPSIDEKESPLGVVDSSENANARDHDIGDDDSLFVDEAILNVNSSDVSEEGDERHVAVGDRSSSDMEDDIESRVIVGERSSNEREEDTEAEGDEGENVADAELEGDESEDYAEVEGDEREDYAEVEEDEREDDAEVEEDEREDDAEVEGDEREEDTEVEGDASCITDQTVLHMQTSNDESGLGSECSVDEIGGDIPGSDGIGSKGDLQSSSPDQSEEQLRREMNGRDDDSKVFFDESIFEGLETEGDFESDSRILDEASEELDDSDTDQSQLSERETTEDIEQNDL